MLAAFLCGTCYPPLSELPDNEPDELDVVDEDDPEEYFRNWLCEESWASASSIFVNSWTSIFFSVATSCCCVVISGVKLVKVFWIPEMLLAIRPEGPRIAFADKLARLWAIPGE